MVIKILFTIILYVIGIEMIVKSNVKRNTFLLEMFFIIIYLVAITVGTVLYTF